MQSAPRSRRGPSLRRNLVALAATALAIGSCNAGGPGNGAALMDPPGGGASCPPANVDATRYLRQLSLDLRGRPPSTDELERVRTAGEVPTALIDQMLASPEFLTQARRWHAALLWPNLEGFRIQATPITSWDSDPRNAGNRTGGLYSPDPALVEDAAAHPRGVVGFAGTGGGDRTLRGGQYTITGCDGTLEYPPPAPPTGSQPTYRTRGSDGVERTYPFYDRDGVPLPYHDAAHCPNLCTRLTSAQLNDPAYRAVTDDFSAMNSAGADPSPHELDPSGMRCPTSHPNRVVNDCDNRFYNGAQAPQRLRREGYRLVRTYWSAGRDVRVCAYEAQDRAFSVTTGNSCAGQQLRDVSCGCGPNGDYCMPVVSFNNTASSRAETRLRSALNEEPLDIVASVVARNEDYFEIFRTRRSYVTGAISQLYRRQMGSVRGLDLGLPASIEAIPELGYTDDRPQEYLRDAEHAGVLTTPAYLGRFPTWRSRVSQFRIAFMCRPFTPATHALPAADDPCTREPNLARRCGCQSCHAALEPMASWFGRWAERSTRFLDTVNYPAFDPNCQLCALRGANCTTRCRTEYVVDTVDADGSRYAGTLRGYLYRNEMERSRIDEGPRGLVDYAIASGELQSCTVRTAWSRLLGRAMGEDEMRTVLPDLVASFSSANHNFRSLVRSIVTSAAYRRVD